MATMARVLAETVGACVDEIGDLRGALADGPDAVHRLRTAVRRWRSVTGGFGRSDPLRVAHDQAHARLVAWHAGDGVVGVDALLAGWDRDLPLRAAAARPAGPAGRRVVRREVRRASDRAERDPAGHETRKAARRLRHVAEVVGADRVAVLGKQVQGALGEFRRRACF